MKVEGRAAQFLEQPVDKRLMLAFRRAGSLLFNMPAAFDIGPAMSRATVSEGPPAWKGATIVTNRLGKSCVFAPDAQTQIAAAIKIAVQFMAYSLSVLTLHLEDLHATHRFLPPMLRNRRTYPAPHSFRDRIGIAPPWLGE